MAKIFRIGLLATLSFCLLAAGFWFFYQLTHKKGVATSTTGANGTMVSTQNRDKEPLETLNNNPHFAVGYDPLPKPKLVNAENQILPEEIKNPKPAKIDMVAENSFTKTAPLITINKTNTQQISATILLAQTPNLQARATTIAKAVQTSPIPHTDQISNQAEEVIVLEKRRKQISNIDSLEKATKGNKITIRVPRRD